MYLDFVSVIAVADRSVQVVEDIAKLLALISLKIEKHQVGWFLAVMLQTAAVFEDRDKWLIGLKKLLRMLLCNYLSLQSEWSPKHFSSVSY